MATPQHAAIGKLDQALSKIEELLQALKDGTLLASGPSRPAAAPVAAVAAPLAAAPAAAAEAAAAAPTPAPAAAPGGNKQGKKEKAAKPAKQAAAAPEGDAFEKAHLAVRAACRQWAVSSAECKQLAGSDASHTVCVCCGSDVCPGAADAAAACRWAASSLWTTTPAAPTSCGCAKWTSAAARSGRQAIL